MTHEQRPLLECLRPVGGMARALNMVCRNNFQLVDCCVLAEMLRPLAALVDELEVVCAGSEWESFTEQSNRYLSALMEVLDTNDDRMEPGWFADLLIPVLVQCDLLDDQMIGGDASQEARGMR